MEHTFAGYPSRWLDTQTRLVAGPDAIARLATLSHLPLTNHEAGYRVTDLAVLNELMKHARDARTAGELIEWLVVRQTPRGKAAATLAWLMKYDLVRSCD
ncbi:MAG: hypothetical protein KY476_20260 [Planctomycetes bacterium]|nr:hypothetical protein [Planctomycetota bacterium]